jgi:dihydrofolate synthase/folylpolyglutamate synthase
MEKNFNELLLQKNLQYLYALDGKGIKPGLKRIESLLDRMGNPHRNIPAIHIAGTNGKGSTCAVIAAVLRAAGYRVGLYTSPHLVRFNERIRINDEKISDIDILDFLQRHRALIDELDATFFETTTALAFEYFYRQKVDVMVLETGLGGRLDATNVVTPILSVITPIGKDHEEFLGNTLSKIAFEKAGIAKPNIPCLAARQTFSVKQTLRGEITKRSAIWFYAPDLCGISAKHLSFDGMQVNIQIGATQLNPVQFSLTGLHQLVNLQTAVSAIHLLKKFPVLPEQIKKGIESVCWRGRLEVLSREPLILYDVGHNIYGIRPIVATLEKIIPGQKVQIILALGQKKKIAHLGKTLNEIADRVYVTEIPNNKSARARDIAAELKKDISAEKICVNECMEDLLPGVTAKLKSADNLIILGSHYIAPLVYNFFKINV